MAAKLKATAEDKRRREAEAEIKASMPFLCPYGCGEGYDTKDKCDRHEKVCARGIAQRCRQQERHAPLNSVPQDQHPPGAVDKSSTVQDSAAAGTAAMSDAVTATMRGLPLLQTSEGTYGNVPFSVVSGEVHAQQVPNQVNYAMQQMSEDVGSTHAKSPYPQLPKHFGSYNCLRCSRGYTKWVDCVAHMVGCCNQLYENGKLWGGVEALRIRCGVEEPGSKRCTGL